MCPLTGPATNGRPAGIELDAGAPFLSVVLFVQVQPVRHDVTGDAVHRRYSNRSGG